MRLAAFLLPLSLFLSACVGSNADSGIDPEIEKQVNLLTQYGPWSCEGVAGEGQDQMHFRSTQIWIKTGASEATTYMQATFANALIEFSTAEVDFMRMQKAGAMTQYPQLFEFRGARLLESAKENVALGQGSDEGKIASLLAMAGTHFAQSSLAEFENPTRWNLSNLSEASLTFSNEQADINCTHADVGTLFDDFGLVVR